VEKYGQNSAGSAEAVLAGTEAWASQRHLQAATVLRGGQAISVTPNTLVVGDVVYLEEGEHVPADLRILAAETIVAPQVRRG
jgi:Bardet-Biedl syndrome 7 protein